VGRVRVLQIISGFAVEGPLGGIERFGIELTRALAQTDFEPVLCGLWRYHAPREEWWLRQLQRMGIDAFLAADWDEDHPYRSFVNACRGIWAHPSIRGVSLVHSHCQFGDIAALLLALPLGVPALVRTVHNEREWPKRPWRRRLLTNLLYPLLFSREVGVALTVRDNLQNRIVARALGREALCIHNAIDIQRFAGRATGDRQGIRFHLGCGEGQPLIITIGRLVPQKGYGFLLKAAALVKTKIPDACFLIVGEGTLRTDLERQARDLGVGDVVRFVGSRSDVEQLLRAADVFVSSSLWEGLPTVILESMAARLPVVATDVSGTRELVEHGVTGLLVPPGDAKALAEAITSLVRDRRLACRMAERAFQHVQRFTIGGVTEEYTALYARLLSR